MKRVLIVTRDKYPNEGAGVVRTENFARIFRSLGYEPFVVGLGNYTDFKVKKENGISYISLRTKEEKFTDKIKNYTEFTKRLIDHVQMEHSFDLIMVVNVSHSTLKHLKKYAKKHNIKLLYDCVEWYSPQQFKTGVFHPTYQIKNNFNSKWVDKGVSVVSISSYLHEYFLSKGIESIRIPVIMDVKNMSCKKNIKEDKIIFVYAGAPGKKDYLSVVVKGFALLTKQQLSNIELRIIGINDNQLIKMCDVSADDIKYIGNSMKCYGRVTREEVMKQLTMADFTVLLRSEELRYAKAGFPTKVVESLATGTPVITNLTSDLGMYIIDGANGFIVENCSADALSNVLKNAITLNIEERVNMQKKSRSTAEEHFDYCNYINKLEKFINKA